ncbi:MAG: YceI family protein [Bacteroidota bacterium]|nr:YceI family protein [Bacteroidota bacterium]
MKLPLLVVALMIAGSAIAQERQLLRLDRSVISFVSDAPLERISASNTQATGIIDPKARTFAVQIPMVEFEGFNSPLQREHFNENYMLSKKWPHATFKGKIIEDVDLTSSGEHTVRAKGEFTLKGVTKERIIPCKIVIGNDGIRATANFEVLLDEHDIRVPRVVQQKISSVVQVELDALFKAQDATQ